MSILAQQGWKNKIKISKLKKQKRKPIEPQENAGRGAATRSIYLIVTDPIITAKITTTYNINSKYEQPTRGACPVCGSWCSKPASRNFMRKVWNEVCLSPPFYSWEKGDSGRVSDSPKAPDLINSAARIQTHLPNVCSFHSTLAFMQLGFCWPCHWGWWLHFGVSGMGL